MRYKIVILVIITLLFVVNSCKKEPSCASIVFKLQDLPLTRATSADIISTSSLKTFYVTAIGNGEVYMDKVAVTKNASGEWVAKGYIWPNYPLEFYAYTPQISGINITPSKIAVPQFTIPTNVGNQQDVLFAYAQGTKTVYENTAVPLTFKHYLPVIEVKALCSNLNYRIDVRGIKLCNLVSKVKIDKSLPLITSSSKSLSEELVESANKNILEYNNFYVEGDNDITLSSTAKSISFNKIFYNYSQVLKDDAYLAVLCRIFKKDVNGKFNLIYPVPTADNTKNDKYAFVAVKLKQDTADTNPMAQGVIREYTLNFFKGDFGGAGLVPPSFTDPTNSSNTIIDTNPFNTTTQAWEPIFGNIYITISTAGYIRTNQRFIGLGFHPISITDPNNDDYIAN